MKDSITDTNIPSSGRMYDYYLGGKHNFEVDRKAADMVLKKLPFLTKYALLQRWTLQDIAEELSFNRGCDVIIDYASGLPTVDHLHTRVKKGTVVIYSDYDPVVVSYSREILGETPDVYYFENDLTRPEELLQRPEVEKILAGKRKVGLCVWGISGFLFDEELSHSMKVLYDWAPPGTCMAFMSQMVDSDVNNPAIINLYSIYASFGQENHPRSTEAFNRLIKPWKLDEKGWIPLLDWHGIERTELAREGAEALGPMGAGFGAYLIK